MNILDLPDCMIEQIFEYLTYDEIARKRLVCRRVDKVCQHLLNIGFSKMIKRHNKDLKRIKSLLPRRESERRNHPLARHADILTCIETRISMLSMTYTKYMDLNLCCFIPGKVIDEVFKILHLVETTTKPLRAHEVLQELRDISSMAIEHFDEKIAHLLKNGKKRSIFAGISGSSSFDNIITLTANQPSAGNSISTFVAHRLSNITIKCPEARSNRLMIQRLEQKYSTAMKKFNRMTQIQNKQTRQLRDNAVIMSEMNSQIVELKRRVEEADAKNREIVANMSQITGEPNPGGGDGGVVGSKVSGVGGVTGAGGCINSTSSIHSSDRSVLSIKPRVATITRKRRVTETQLSSTASSTSNQDIIGDILTDITKKAKRNL